MNAEPFFAVLEQTCGTPPYVPSAPSGEQNAPGVTSPTEAGSVEAGVEVDGEVPDGAEVDGETGSVVEGEVGVVGASVEPVEPVAPSAGTPGTDGAVEGVDGSVGGEDGKVVGGVVSSGGRP